MARRRDTVTKMFARAAKASGKTIGQYIPVENKAWRVRGRRAVRARARANRIVERARAGTYTQPSATMTTNS